MRKVPAFILAGTIVLSGILTGCGGNNDTSENGGEVASELFTKIEEDNAEVVQEDDGADDASALESSSERGELANSDESEKTQDITESSEPDATAKSATSAEDSDDDNATESDNAAGNNGRNSNEDDGILSSSADINLHDDGSGKNYTFTYNGEDFSAIYIEDNWKIIDSYKINSVSDMLYICQALIDEKPVHGRDMQSYRDAEDMAYEWVQHNMAYQILPDGNDMKAHAKDVDFDPQDQNKDFDEIYKDRTGKELSLDDILDKLN
ncbi:hypothetical protein SAMN04487770_102134 [Butyrivibrio sp. ob235]|uniref:hypothetical protein n=1 Tax=Butyrivibrio sp. ob235 TaxID=1761780 RepID=UPI0008C384B7|nr:hypothetical protein [Butyrivibrio sp. ob235]SEK63490.1 hypothetical protein SAMN04487770_102134 [Butyrivibrio sp. ob235]